MLRESASRFAATVQHLRRSACRLRRTATVVALIAFAILEVQRHDAVVMLLQESDGVLVRGGEVADVEIGGDKAVRLHGVGQALRGGELVGSMRE